MGSNDHKIHAFNITPVCTQGLGRGIHSAVSLVITLVVPYNWGRAYFVINWAQTQTPCCY